MKIVFLDRYTAGPIELVERFSKYGEYIEYDDTADLEIEERLKDVDVVILNRIKITREIMQKLPKLKLILITATGFNHIDINAANEFGIKVANVKGYSTNSVSQLTMTFLLNELTPVVNYSEQVKLDKWDNLLISEFQNYPVDDAEDKVLGIVGYGNIGKKVEKIAKTLGMKVMISKIPGREYDKNDERIDFEKVLEKSDIISIHAPLTDLTRNLFDIEAFKKMKKSAILLNLGRGPIVNQEDLYTALKDGLIRSAAIDVTSVEPIEKNSKMFELKNLTITPHIAWKSQKSLERLMNDIENNLKLFLNGKLEGLR